MEDKVYKYRMDLYYQLLLIYVGFFFLYAVIKGRFFEEKFTLVFNDPIIFILAIFILIFLLIVLVQIITARQIILKSDRAILKNRFGSREIMYNEILNIKIGRKRIKNDETPYRIIKLKLLNRRKWLRIRSNDFERGSDLIKEFLKIKNPVKI
jgi:hypothetical protein